MPIRRAGNSGLTLSALGLGLGSWGQSADGSPARVGRADGFLILDRALEYGISHWDTASGYAGGDSERIVGEYFASRGNSLRDQVTLSTKWWSPEGAGRGAIRRAVDGCLGRLRTDYIDIFMLHNPMVGDDGRYLAPIDETWGALDDLVTEGKIHYLGLSNAHAINLHDTLASLARVGKDSSRRLALVENAYNVIRRGQVGRGLWTDWRRGTTEEAFMADLAANGVGLIPYWAIAAGALSGKYRKSQPDVVAAKRLANPLFGAEYLEGPTFEAIEALAVFADAREVPLSHLAIAWLLAKPVVASVLLGATSITQLDQVATAATFSLSAQELAEVDAIAATAETVDQFISRKGL